MWDRWNDEQRDACLDALLLFICAIFYYAFSKVLPEWMVNILLIGAITLSICLYEVGIK